MGCQKLQTQCNLPTIVPLCSQAWIAKQFIPSKGKCKRVQRFKSSRRRWPFSPDVLSFRLTLASGARPKTRLAWQRLARPGFPDFWPGLPGKCGLVKPGKHGHGQAATLATKAWPFWSCYFQGRAFAATLVKKAWPSRP